MVINRFNLRRRLPDRKALCPACQTAVPWLGYLVSRPACPTCNRPLRVVREKDDEQIQALFYLPGAVAFAVALWWMDFSAVAWVVGLAAMFLSPIPLFGPFHPFLVRYELLDEVCLACKTSRHGAGLSPCRVCGASAWPKERFWAGPSPSEWLRGGPVPGGRLLMVIAASAGLLILMLISTPQYLPQFESLAWPKADGVVTSSSVVTRYWRDVELHHPAVQYQYSVGPQTYSGKRIAFKTESGGTAQVAADVLGPYPQGAHVPVYYNPSNPGEAVLEPGIKGEQRLLFWIGMFFIAASALTLVYAAKMFAQMRIEGASLTPPPA